MSEVVPNNDLVIMAPVPSADDYTASVDLWEALTMEIDSVVARIDRGEELTPEDVVNVRSLKKQVESYLTMFNKAMRDAQVKYKDLVAKQLAALGYGKIETYIATRREKQTKEQADRQVAKQAKLKAIVESAITDTVHVKDTVLAGELLPAFTARFPIVNSGAKNSGIANWGPYEAIVKTTLQMLDVFFSDPVFDGAKTLPLPSATMAGLLAYVRDGDLGHLSVMRTVFAKDAELLIMQKLRTAVTDKETALRLIAGIAASGKPVDERLRDIDRVMRVAETLEK